MFNKDQLRRMGLSVLAALLLVFGFMGTVLAKPLMVMASRR